MLLHVQGMQLDRALELQDSWAYLAVAIGPVRVVAAFSGRSLSQVVQRYQVLTIADMMSVLLELAAQDDRSVKLNDDLSVSFKVRFYDSVDQDSFLRMQCRVVVCHKCQNEAVRPFSYHNPVHSVARVFAHRG